MDVFFISGKGNYGTKSSGSLRVNDLLFDHELDLYGAQFYTSLGDVSLISSNKKTHYSAGICDELIGSDTRLSVDLLDFWLETYFIGEWEPLASLDSEVNLKSFNIGYSKTLGNFDIYFEYDANTYNKILRNDNVDGSSKYFSIATDFLGADFLYEFKDYDMIYYMPIISNSPLVFNESSSVLISRNQHSINFADEIGHQLESRFSFKDVSFLVNLSMGRKHVGISDPYGDIYEKPTFSDLLGMDFLDEDLRAHKPFRDFYIEGNGWNKSNNFYYKLGYHSHYSYDDVSGKNYKSQTIPTQFVWSVNNNNSVTLYYEIQKTDNLDTPTPDGEYDINNLEYEYMSLSYHINGFGGISFFRDHKDKTATNGIQSNGSWSGIELTFELSSSMQLSIFQGSQKGGLVCANGICAVQPSFEDGTKITLRALF
jgi:hypothetical protein